MQDTNNIPYGVCVCLCLWILLNEKGVLNKYDLIFVINDFLVLFDFDCVFDVQTDRC